MPITKFVVRVGSLFLNNTRGLSAEYPESKIFTRYQDALTVAMTRAQRITMMGMRESVEIIADYGTDAQRTVWSNGR